MEESLRIYDKFVDREGRTTLNQVEYIEHRKLLAAKKKAENKVKDSKMKKKGKL